MEPQNFVMRNSPPLVLSYNIKTSNICLDTLSITYTVIHNAFLRDDKNDFHCLLSDSVSFYFYVFVYCHRLLNKYSLYQYQNKCVVTLPN